MRPVAPSLLTTMDHRYIYILVHAVRSVKLNKIHYPQTVLSSTTLQCRRELYSPLGSNSTSSNEVPIIIILCKEGLILLAVVIIIIFFNTTYRTAFGSTQNLRFYIIVPPFFSQCFCFVLFAWPHIKNISNWPSPSLIGGWLCFVFLCFFNVICFLKVQLHWSHLNTLKCVTRPSLATVN